MRRMSYRTRKAQFIKKMIVVLSLVLCAILAVGSTLAWLSTKTDRLVNTFTYGDINITLGETPAEYKMIPGNDIAKDPKVTVVAGSEDCWLFVKVEESDNFDNFMTYGIADGWTALTGVDGVYYREVAAGEAGTPYSVLAGDKVSVKDTVTKDMLNADDYTDPTLTFTAYAVQKDNVTSAAAAWAIANPNA